MYIRVRLLHFLAILFFFLAINLYFYAFFPADHWRNRDQLESSNSLKHASFTDSGPPLGSASESLLCVLAVMTGPQNFASRMAVRETWKADLPRDCSLYFIIGFMGLSKDLQESVTQEKEKFGDILIFLALHDSYNNLGKKLLLSLSYFALDFMHTFKYLVKADDDVYVDIKRLVADMKKKDDAPLYWGYFSGDARVKVKGPWAEPNFHLCDRYLPYARGGAYILSHHLVKFVARNKEDLDIYNSEDVSLGVWLAPTKHTKLHDVRFDTEAVSRGCSNAFIVTHKVSPEAMSQLHQQLKSSGKLCEKEAVRKPSYEYNFAVPPSQCCGKGRWLS